MKINFESSEDKLNSFVGMDLLFKGVTSEEQGEYKIFGGIQWKVGAHMTCIVLNRRWLFPFSHAIRFWVRSAYQLRQFKKPTPAKDSWAYNLAATIFDLQMLWDYTIKHRKPDVDMDLQDELNRIDKLDKEKE